MKVAVRISQLLDVYVFSPRKTVYKFEQRLIILFSTPERVLKGTLRT
jgi:hypothetical protein